MKKNFIKATLAVAAIAAVGLGSYKAYGSYTAANMSANDLLLAENVLALSDNNGGCVSTNNGYREWKTSSVFGSKKEFYDCCSVLRSGYKPSGNCN